MSSVLSRFAPSALLTLPWTPLFLNPGSVPVPHGVNVIYNYNLTMRDYMYYVAMFIANLIESQVLD